VARLRDGATAFARLSLGERIGLARSMQAGYVRVAEQSVRAGCQAKGITPGTPLEGEEWGSGPWCVVRYLRLIAESLEGLDRSGNPPIGSVKHLADGGLAVGVLPGNRLDRVLFSGITIDARLEAGMSESDLHARRASWYKWDHRESATVLVLGAGNIASIPPMDVITKMFIEGKVCLLKMNPVNAYLGPFIEEAFGEAIRRKFLAVTYGGAEEGEYLANHPGIAEIHLTGSDRTYNAIVWGPPGPDRESRKARNQPLLSKPFSAELGNISPVIVMPGVYSNNQLEFQAAAIAGAAVFNAGFNCNSAKMLVTPLGWRQRGHLLRAVEGAFQALPTRKAYYPGAEQRWRRLTSNRSKLKKYGSTADGHLPWTLMPGLDSTNPHEAAFSTEPFCSILSETEIGSSDPIEFLERAVDFVNRRLWGTLSASLVVPASAFSDPRIAEAVERAIARLRYGVVTINGWTGLIYSCGAAPWGAYPGSSQSDIQSGTGWVHNAGMLEGVEKVVMRHPLTVAPKPVSFPNHRTAHTLMRRITALDERASWMRLAGVVAAALRG
jgi:aldehyde dehydrogenase (NAD(P)+)